MINIYRAWIIQYLMLLPLKELQQIEYYLRNRYGKNDNVAAEVKNMTNTDAIAAYQSENVQLFNLTSQIDFSPEKRVRKKLFKTEQLWTEIACYEPGQGAVMHKHPLEEEMIYIIEGRANMNIGGEEITVAAGELVKFPANIMHDIRNLSDSNLVIMFTKSPRKLQRKQA